MEKQIKIEEYARLFVKDLSSVWSIAKIENGYEVTFPNGRRGLIRGEDTQWAHDFADDPITSRLWFHSLSYAPHFYWDYGDWDTTAAVFSSYARFFQEQLRKPGYRPMNSLDHAHSVQLLVVSTTYASLIEKGELTPDREKVLVDFVETIALSATADGMITANNHGMMLTRSLAHVGFAFEGKTDMAARCKELGKGRFDEIIRGAFDEEGIANENTPAYQVLYMRVIETMITFLSQTEGEDDPMLVKWKALMELARDSLALQLFPDGTIPPIGDDAGGPSPYAGRIGELYSPTNGIFVRKDDEQYVSIISGNKGVVHKQFDDTSIRIQYKGVDLLIDAGLLSYDVTDRIGRSIVSQRGHSGLYFTRFDDIVPRDVFSANPPRQSGSLTRGVDDKGYEYFDCSYVIDDLYKAKRRYTFLSRSKIEINDAYSAPDATEPVVQRFILPRRAQLTFNPSGVRVDVDDASLVIETEGDNGVRVYHGSQAEQPKGWRAVKQYNSEPCWCLEISPAQGVLNMNTSIAFGDKTLDRRP
ncbi:hypothetical protein [Arthrobacter sp. UYEF3]|uniref:hypothetical protein n=1 Tax=Arthrobacter sp. UYEF3 TaxID=1756365 RepID=UPI0033913026